MSQPAASPASSQRIITKDSDYEKLLTAPLRDDFVRTYSQGYRDRSAEIDAKVAEIQDVTVRNKIRADLWANVSQKDQNRFAYEADVALREARISFSQKHRDGWLDIGHATYSENEKSLIVKSSPTGPIDTYLRVSVDSATINQIFDKFRQITGSEIDRQAHEYVIKSGADSPCARNSDWCYKIKHDEIEQSTRTGRMVVVTPGDLEQKKISRYLLVDYATETILSELAPQSLNLTGVTWRFSIGPVPTLPVEPEPVVAAAEPPPAALAEPAPSPEQPAEVVPTENVPAPAPKAPSPAENTPARVQVPADVIAASIITHISPHYPPKARAAHIHGDVVLHATIDKEGKVLGVQVLSGDDSLAESAVEAVRQWRYKPILIDGEPAEVDTTITITFSLIE